MDKVTGVTSEKDVPSVLAKEAILNRCEAI